MLEAGFTTDWLCHEIVQTRKSVNQQWAKRRPLSPEKKGLFKICAGQLRP